MRFHEAKRCRSANEGTQPARPRAKTRHPPVLVSVFQCLLHPQPVAPMSGLLWTRQARQSRQGAGHQVAPCRSHSTAHPWGRFPGLEYHIISLSIYIYIYICISAYLPICLPTYRHTLHCIALRYVTLHYHTIPYHNIHTYILQCIYIYMHMVCSAVPICTGITYWGIYQVHHGLASEYHPLFSLLDWSWHGVVRKFGPWTAQVREPTKKGSGSPCGFGM